MSSWKILVFCYIVTSGLWAFFLKIVSARLDWKTMMLYVWMTVFVIFVVFYFKDIKLGWSKFHMLAILAGIIASLGTVAFYKAITLAPVSLVVPLASQYILITAILGVFFLKEPLTLRMVAGIACSILAILFLSK